MDLQQLRCFVAAAEDLHFGHAAQRLDMLPAAFGRHIRLLEQDFGTQLFLRTTRSVALSPRGQELLEDARRLIADADALASRFRSKGRQDSDILRIGTIDTVAAGLLPELLQDFRAAFPLVQTRIIEDKTIRLLPRLLSGRIDIAFVRPPETRDRRIAFRHLFHETPVVAVPHTSTLAAKSALTMRDLADAPLIVPDRRSRPHSHDLTIKLFAEAGIPARISQFADEKQTIITLVAAGLGIAIVPRWTARLAIAGVCYLDLELDDASSSSRLPLAAAYLKGTRDSLRDSMLDLVTRQIERYAAQA